MFSSVWNRMWVMHDQVIDMFKFFIGKSTLQTMFSQHDDGGGSRRSENASTHPESKEQSSQTNNNQGGGGGNGENRSYTTRQRIGLILGPLLFIIALIFLHPGDLSWAGTAIAASTLWIATWWITEAVPIPVTSLLPLILFPLTQGLEMDDAAAAYGDDTIFLFMGGFMIALAMEKWNLHRRIAISIISAIGTNMNRIVLGFMVATGFLSMWISNSATAMMMVPIGLAIIYQVSDSLDENRTPETTNAETSFSKALMLGIAYSASIGGISTLIGTPPNSLFKGAVSKIYGMDISFAQWMLFGVPFAWIFILVAWFYLIKFAFPNKIKSLPGGREVIDEEKKQLGTSSSEEKLVFTIFILAALAWITRSFLLEKIFPDITDGTIAMIFAVLLFIIPAINIKGDRLLDWATAVKLPWGILLLFGGGLSIAEGFEDSGLSKWLGLQLSALEGVHIIIVITAVTTLVIFLTEITSNTATASMMFPIMASLASALSVHPYGLMVAAGVAASCAFMLPVATPPNAVVFGSGYLEINDMAKAGFWLNIMGIILVVLAVYFLFPVVWGIDLNTLPDAFNN